MIVTKNGFICLQSNNLLLAQSNPIREQSNPSSTVLLYPSRPSLGRLLPPPRGLEVRPDWGHSPPPPSSRPLLLGVWVGTQSVSVGSRFTWGSHRDALMGETSNGDFPRASTESFLRHRVDRGVDSGTSPKETVSRYRRSLCFKSLNFKIRT